VPAVCVATSTFVRNSQLMARVRGLPDYGFAVIPHPLSSDGDDAVREKAADAVRQAVRLLTDPARNAPRPDSR
jgi:hypothetical protein